MPGFDDAVRASQLPTSTPAQLYLSQYNLAANAPVIITPGFGGQGGGQLPPIHTWSTHFSITITSYCEAANAEKGGAEEGGGAKVGENKKHVKRVFQKDEQGKPNPDVYVDLLRIDQVVMAYNSEDSGKGGQHFTYVVHWNDKNDEDSNQERETHQIKVKNPEAKDEFIEVTVIEELTAKSNSPEESGAAGQEIKFKFLKFDDEESDKERLKTETVKVVNNDLGDMEMANDDGSEPKLVDWKDYQKAMSKGQKDEDQSVDVDVSLRWMGNFNVKDTGSGGQRAKFVLHNQEIVDLFKKGDPKAEDVVKTDPLQMVVNVGWGGLAAEFGDKAADAPGPPKKKGEGA